MYRKVSTSLDFAEREKEIAAFWKENGIFKKSIWNREGSPVYSFYDGPPTANGKPHIGHIITRAVKDIIPRYRTMKGYKVLRKAGWDTHGLPVELEVEKLLGINGKPEIEKYGVEAFIRLCKESVWRYKKEWEIMSERVGFWADMENPYITYTNEYIESVWWALKTIWDKGLLYKGHKIIPYCSRCGTSLSSHEVAQGYEDVTERSIYVKFPVEGEEGTFLLAWTTTPWTLPSNVALAVNPKCDFIKARCRKDVLILAKDLAGSILENGYEILEEMKGSELEHLRYRPLFDLFSPGQQKAFYVTLGDFVTLSDGTGIVHIAPAFGEDDAVVGRRYGLPFLQFVDEQGNMTVDTQFLQGLFVKEADPLIVKYLEGKGLLFKTAEYTHSYPFCWRCDTPLIYYARDTWFIAMTRVKEEMIQNNRQIRWIPENIRDGRFGNFLENLMDWGISRERYWGTPLPIWECGCGYRTAVGSIAELRKKGIDVPENIELHKPAIDRVFLICDECGGRMKRVSEVIDCWFDSGAMPFAQWHYPFENQEIFRENFPADFISEALDQTRGWFYTLLAISTLLFNQSAYRNVIVLGLVQDKDGQKMSKHKGNVIDPIEVLDRYGADAVRWYFYTCSAPWLPSRFSMEAVCEGQRKFMGTLWNTYAFFVLYADIDGFHPGQHSLNTETLCIMDRWILSKLHTLIRDVETDLDQYRITEAARRIQAFVEELSNWYVRRGRERYWQSENTQDKIDAYMTLYTVLVELSKICAPFIPFMSEQIYQNLVRSWDLHAPESVHLTDYPHWDPAFLEPGLEDDMDKVRNMVVLGRNIRNTAGIKNRQPLAVLFLQDDPGLDKTFLDLVRAELNVKEIIRLEDPTLLDDYRLKPQLRTAGPKFGSRIPLLIRALEETDGREVVNAFRRGEFFRLETTGGPLDVKEEDILVETVRREGYAGAEGSGMRVILDLRLTPELIEEGFVREIISKIQTMRKEAGYEVTDHIRVMLEGDVRVQEIVRKHISAILREILAEHIHFSSRECDMTKEWMLNGEKVIIGICRI